MSEINSPAGFLVEGTEAFKIAQSVYHAVTGKTEKLSKSFSQNFRVTMDDIQQLHEKFVQVSGQWRIIESNENVTIQHLDDNKAVFSSIERAKIYDKSQTSPIESVSYEFNMLAAIPNLDRPQPYRVTVRILSSIAVFKKMEEDAIPSAFFRIFRAGNIVVEVEYIDYVIARNIISTLDSWVAEIEITSEGKLLKFVQKYSHWLSRVAGAGIFVISVFSVLSMSSLLFGDSVKNEELARFLIIGASFIVGASAIAAWVGRLAESGIDRVRAMSYILMNRGDERLLEAFKKKNILSISKAAISIVAVVLQGILTSTIATYLYDKIRL